MKPVYLQIFSMTDHNAALHGRYQGPYQGLNAELQTSEYQNGSLIISPQTKYHAAPLPVSAFEEALVAVCYRHSDTGQLKGTSESLICIKQLPWLDMPGFEVLSCDDSATLKLKLWNQEVHLAPGKVTRIHFAKTIVYLKNFGHFTKVAAAEKDLSFGPSHLHAEEIDDNVTIAPPTGSGFVVKMGQEIEH